MIAKDTYYAQETWISEQKAHWMKQSKGRRTPTEAYINAKLRDSIPRNASLVQSLTHSVFATLRMFRIYMEFYEYGDLQSVLNHHWELGYKSNSKGNKLEK